MLKYKQTSKKNLLLGSMFQNYQNIIQNKQNRERTDEQLKQVEKELQKFD